MIEGAKLLLVPDVCGVEALNVLKSVSVVSLDEMLMSGVSGDYFRRLRVEAALYAAVREQYEDERTAYLKAVLSEVTFTSGVLFVGTRASDVDLVDFVSVHVVSVRDEALRSMSRMVHGDPYTMYMEAVALSYATVDAVNGVFTLVDWSGLPALVGREYGVLVSSGCELSVGHQRQILCRILASREDAAVRLEPALHMLQERSGVVMASGFDYLEFVTPVWRDAVVRLLGEAPSVGEIFRLPWFMVATGACERLCYRPAVDGRLVATSRGYSLVKYVRTHLSGVLTSRELIGTWLAGVLGDDALVVDVARVLGSEPLVSSGVVSECVSDTAFPELVVPEQYLWAYAAVPGVVGTGFKGVAESPLACDYDAGCVWTFSFPFVELFARVANTAAMRVALVQFVARLHAVPLASRFLRDLYRHAVKVVQAEDGELACDLALTSMLPGYEYLQVFDTSVRRSVALECGRCPSAVDLADCSRDHAEYRLFPKLAAHFARMYVFSSEALMQHAVLSDGSRRCTGLALAGAEVVPSDPGYCYLVAYRPGYQVEAARELGAYPKLSAVLDSRYSAWFVDGYMDRICVAIGAVFGVGCVASPVLHFSLGGSGVVLREYVRLRGCVGWSTYDLPVGDGGACVSSQWFVLAVIAWTIVGCVLVALLVWFIYLKCSGKRGTGGRGGGRGFY